MDVNNQPLIGVNIVEKGTSNGTSSDFDGRFQLNNVSETGRLLISYIGYEGQEVAVNGQSSFDIVLAENKQTLDQVVVVGYGTQERSEVTGSISSVKGEDMGNLPVAGASQALQGRAAGVQVVRNGGAPGSGGSIRIRGTGTVNNANPLVVIDGVPAGSMNDVNPNDIESIEVLKDASTAAIYGLRAANGVVIITTKRGKFNENLSFTVNGYTGTSNVVNTIDVLTAPQLAELKRERYVNDGLAINPIWEDPNYLTQKTNWQDELLGTGLTQNLDFTLRGGSENSAFAISGGYYNEEGVINHSLSQKFYFRINSDHKIGNWLTIGENLQITRQRGFGVNTSSAQTGLLWSAIRFHPGLPIINADGSYSSSQVSGEFGDINNPIYTVDHQDSENTRNRLLTNVFLEMKIVDGLKFKSNYALDGNLSDSYNFSVQITDQIRQNALADLGRGYSSNYSLLAEYYLNYNKVIAKDHSIDMVGGYTAQTFQYDNFSAWKQDYPNESLTQRVLDAGRTFQSISGSQSEINLASVFGRVNYSYKGKYLLSATLRRDGTSRFAEANRWGNFPAISAGWRVNRESWFGDSKVVSFLKLNGGWGRLGNQSVSAFQYLALISSTLKNAFGNNQATGSSLSRIPNENIGWETTEMLDFGVEIGLFDNRWLATVNYFDKKTEDMLIAPPTIGSIGRASIPDQNIGSLKNSGIEIELTYRDEIGELGLTLSGNASLIKNEVLDLGGREFLGSQFYGRPNQEIARTYVGTPIGTFYGWKADGLYQNQTEIDTDPALANDERRDQELIQPGDVRFLDLNGDGQIDAEDRTILGDPFPDVTFGLNTSLDYKGFDLNVYILGVAGVEIFNADRMQGLDPTYSFNMYAETLNRWTGENTSNSIPRMTTKRNNVNHRTSDLFIEKGDFLRLKNLTLGYSLPNAITSKIGMASWRFYISGQNVITLTGYSGMDPELGYVDGNLQANVDYAQYPQARTFIFGTSIKF
ncbi:TonB-dependent receptor [Membranihabitans marinus]